MDDLNNQDRTAFAAVDHALRTFPLASPPSALASKVIARIRAEAQLPSFRLTWLDYVTSAFGASAASVMLFLLQSMPLQNIIETELQSTLLVNRLLSNFWNVLATGCWYCAR